jgi:small subunit ribosomal protein S8
MMVNDPIGDMLTRIRNGQSAGDALVRVLPSKINENVLKVLQDEGYINSYEAIGEAVAEKLIQVELRYFRKVGAIKEIKRVSKPGRRIYMSIAEIKQNRHYNGLGVIVLSTPKGVISDKQAIEENVGGEVLCKVF